MGNRILVVDSNVNRFEQIQKEWIKHNIFAQRAASMQAALMLLEKTDFLLVMIISDNIEYLPHLSLMRDMKPIPILVFSSEYNAPEKLEAIQLGADEYLAYPFTLEEMVASGRALIRRYTVLNNQDKQPVTIITHHEIIMYVEYRKLFLKGREVELTRKEFDLLHLMLSNIGRVFTYKQIYKHIWNDEIDSVSENYAVWCLAARIRKKLRSVPDTLEYIKTVREVGYCINITFE